MKLFEASRNDGRSDRQVVFELVRDADPETTYSYEDMCGALTKGTDREITRGVVYRAAGAANHTLMRERKRALVVVRNVGYRVIRADEHLTVALVKKDRAETMVQRGIELLRHARVDELDEPHRTLHEGQLLVMSGFYDALRSTRRRQEQHDETINALLERVDKLEAIS